jgi:hypothetical protein
MIHTDGIQTIANAEYSVRVPEPQSPQEANLNAAIDEAMEFAAFRCFDTLLYRLTPLVETGRANAVDIIGILAILRDEYQGRYEAVRRDR